MIETSIAARRSKALILAAVFLVAVVIPICVTGPAVAIPAMAAAIGGSAGAYAWVMNGFLLGVGSTVMLGGTLADQYGRKRVFLIGLLGFCLLSFAIAAAHSILLIDLLRGLQGVAGALTMSAAFAALAQEFEGSARTRALGLIGSGFGIGIAFGPVIAGVIVGIAGWRTFFLACAAIGLVVLVVGVPRLRETRDPGATGIDIPGAASFTATLLTLNAGLVLGPEYGWTDGRVLGLLFGAAALLLTFIIVERRHRRPMLDLSLFSNPRFVGAQALPVGVAYSFVIPFFLLPVRFIRIEGMSEFTTGLMLLPLSAPVALVPFTAAHLTRWIPNGMLAAGGLFISGLGIVWLAAIPIGASPAAFVAPLLVAGIGAGLPWGLMDDLAISIVPKERAGMATGIFSTMRVAGEAIALAIVGAVIAGYAAAVIGPAVTPAMAGPVSVAVANGSFAEAQALAPDLGRAALVDAYGRALATTFMLCGIVSMLASAIGLLALGRRRPAPVATLLPMAAEEALPTEDALAGE